MNTIKYSNKLISVSEFVRQTALLNGIPPENITTIPNTLSPVLLNRNRDDSLLQEKRKELGIDKDAPLITAVGRLDRGKGHLVLFDAFAQVLLKVPNARLLICGDSRLDRGFEDHLKQRVKDLHLDSHVIFTGFRDDILEIMQMSNVFCLPSELEPFGLVFLEAMASGVPVVAYHSGGIPESVIHTKTGLLSYPGDLESLISNLIKLLCDKNHAQILGENGKLRANSDFSPYIIADKWFSVLQRLA